MALTGGSVGARSKANAIEVNGLFSLIMEEPVSGVGLLEPWGSSGCWLRSIFGAVFVY